jgi:hypothetical protein
MILPATVTTDRTSFIADLSKPKTIGAFQQKSTATFKKSMALKTNIPVQFNVPQIK